MHLEPNDLAPEPLRPPLRPVSLGIDPATATAAAEKVPELAKKGKEIYTQVKEGARDVKSFLDSIFGRGPKGPRMPEWMKKVVYYLLKEEERQKYKKAAGALPFGAGKRFEFLWKPVVSKETAIEILAEHEREFKDLVPTRKIPKKLRKKKKKVTRPKKPAPAAEPAAAPPAAPIVITQPAPAPVSSPELRAIEKKAGKILDAIRAGQKEEREERARARFRDIESRITELEKKKRGDMQPVAQRYDPKIKAYRIYGLGAPTFSVSFGQLGADPPGELFDVERVQQVVADLGEPISVDGIWGPGSREALIRVAQKHGLLSSPRKAGDYYSSTSRGYPRGKVMVRPIGFINKLEEIARPKPVEIKKVEVSEEGRRALERDRARAGRKAVKKLRRKAKRKARRKARREEEKIPRWKRRRRARKEAREAQPVELSEKAKKEAKKEKKKDEEKIPRWKRRRRARKEEREATPVELSEKAKKEAKKEKRREEERRAERREERPEENGQLVQIDTRKEDPGLPELGPGKPAPTRTPFGWLILGYLLSRA